MFVSIKFILKQLIENETLEKVGGYTESELKLHKSFRQWFINLENSQIDKSLPCVLIDQNEKAVVLYCNDALFEVVKKYQNTPLENISFMDGMKIYKEVKNLMEKK